MQWRIEYALFTIGTLPQCGAARIEILNGQLEVEGSKGFPKGNAFDWNNAFNGLPAASICESHQRDQLERSYSCSE